ncbi:class I SAM-dependent methyltransferase [Chloroflexus islandicus]|uniref:class I SAM-dependent methyltransferase n=1 Tax=Chloroflexus islandicus TaxID=1707952 RepID=UPI000976A0A7|nr:class I SAM-dependent methyltransferase [Chloroflexus islandicus]
MIKQSYLPRNYWETRLSQRFDLTGVGHIALGPAYNASLYKRRLETLSKGLAQIKQPLTGARVFEVGCGTGFYTNYFAKQHVLEYLGLDITSISTKTLKQRYPLFYFVCADIANFAYFHIKERFDIVFAADVLFHITEDERFDAALHTMASCLKTGGCCIISDIFPQRTVRSATHVHLRSFDTYHQILQKHQLQILHIEPIFTVLHPPPIKNNSFWWDIYTYIWKIQRSAIKNPIIDKTLPHILEWLDRKIFCPRYGMSVPNSKWLFARKT